MSRIAGSTTRQSPKSRQPKGLAAATAKMDAWAYAIAYVILQRQMRDHWSAAT